MHMHAMADDVMADDVMADDVMADGVMADDGVDAKQTGGETEQTQLAELPVDLQQLVVRKMGSRGDCIVDLQRLACTSKAMDRMVTQAPIWRKLTFSKTTGPGMDDDSLRRLLIKVNAHANMKKLELFFCKRVTGVGLSPLQGALQLKELDLRTGSTSLPGDPGHPETAGIGYDKVTFLPFGQLTSFFGPRSWQCDVKFPGSAPPAGPAPRQRAPATLRGIPAESTRDPAAAQWATSSRAPPPAPSARSTRARRGARRRRRHRCGSSPSAAAASAPSSSAPSASKTSAAS